MATAVSRAITCKAAKRKESLVDRFLNYYKENQATIVCGILSMNGSANVYPLYKALTK